MSDVGFLVRSSGPRLDVEVILPHVTFTSLGMCFIPPYEVLDLQHKTVG